MTESNMTVNGSVILQNQYNNSGHSNWTMENIRAPGRKLLDAFGDSLLYTNRLYSKEYGITTRKVMSHMPHFFDKKIFQSMIDKFKSEFRETSSHRLRRGDDMQLAFAFFHFLVAEKLDFNVADIFDEFDTDNSGTWSDREIRTLLTRIHQLPLRLESVTEFENLIVNCSKMVSTPVSAVVTPAFERYYDSHLPVVSKDLVTHCTALVKFLGKHFEDRLKHRHEIVSNPDVAFKRLTANMSQVIGELDDLRRNPRKFVCINDDIDATVIDNDNYVHAILIDYFESVLPVPSQFELPPDYRNKFRYISELEKWLFYKNLLHFATYFCTFVIIMLIIASYFNIDLDEWILRKRSKTEKKYNV